MRFSMDFGIYKVFTHGSRSGNPPPLPSPTKQHREEHHCMMRVLSTALAVLAITTATLTVHTSASLTPGITLIGKGEVSGSATDKSGLTGNICQQGVPRNCYSK